ncbi:MAG: DUF4235 domain-containing protein [Solirubrobacterales bacterium]
MKLEKLIFAPVGIGAGIVGGLLARKAFDGIWGAIDEEEPPGAEDREVAWPKLVAALAIEGAVFRLVKGMVDHGARRGFASFTGAWPGDERPEPQPD